MNTHSLSNEYIETREDEIAQLIICSQDVDKLRELANMLHAKNMITTAYYHDLRDTLDNLSAGILMGKRNTAALRNGGDGVLLCDPPWEYDISHRNGAAAKHYSTMSLDALIALPVADLAADDSVLIMWATWPKLEEAALPLMRAWGFQYVTGFPWVKIKGLPQIDLFGDLRIKPAWGTGYWIRGATEPILIGRRGNASPPTMDWAGILCERMQHSRKPESIHHYAMSLPGPYCELFARRPYPGWDTWGNQVDSTIEMNAAVSR